MWRAQTELDGIEGQADGGATMSSGQVKDYVLDLVPNGGMGGHLRRATIACIGCERKPSSDRITRKRQAVINLC